MSVTELEDNGLRLIAQSRGNDIPATSRRTTGTLKERIERLKSDGLSLVEPTLFTAPQVTVQRDNLSLKELINIYFQQPADRPLSPIQTQLFLTANPLLNHLFVGAKNLEEVKIPKNTNISLQGSVRGFDLQLDSLRESQALLQTAIGTDKEPLPENLTVNGRFRGLAVRSTMRSIAAQIEQQRRLLRPIEDLGRVENLILVSSATNTAEQLALNRLVEKELDRTNTLAGTNDRINPEAAKLANRHTQILKLQIAQVAGMKLIGSGALELGSKLLEKSISYANNLLIPPVALEEERFIRFHKVQTLQTLGLVSASSVELKTALLPYNGKDIEIEKLNDAKLSLAVENANKQIAYNFRLAEKEYDRLSKILPQPEGINLVQAKLDNTIKRTEALSTLYSVVRDRGVQESYLLQLVSLHTHSTVPLSSFLNASFPKKRFSSQTGLPTSWSLFNKSFTEEALPVRIVEMLADGIGDNGFASVPERRLHLRYVEEAAYCALSRHNTGRANKYRQILLSAARTLGDAEVSSRAELFNSIFLSNENAHEAATSRAKMSVEFAKAIPVESSKKKELLSVALLNQTAILHASATNNPDAGAEISKIRIDLQRSPEVSQDLVHRLVLREAHAYLLGGKVKVAEETVRYAESLPNISAQREKEISHFFNAYRTNRSEAALRSALAAANSGDMEESILYGLTGALTMGTAGAIMGTGGLALTPYTSTAGFLGGFIIGGIFGTTALKMKGLYKGRAEITEAFDSGLTPITRKQAGIHLAVLGSDIFTSYVGPYTVAKRLGSEGMSAIFKGAGSQLSQLAIKDIESRLGAQAVSKMTIQQIQGEIADHAIKEFVTELRNFGGKKLIAYNTTAMLAPFGIDFLSVRSNPDLSEEDKKAARRVLMARIPQLLGLAALFQVGESALTAKVGHAPISVVDLRKRLTATAPPIAPPLVVSNKIPVTQQIANLEVHQTASAPPMIEPYLRDAKLPWYRQYVELPDGQFDPFFRELAKRHPRGELVIAGGSDLVQSVIGLPKALPYNSAEVNLVAPKGYAPLTEWIQIPGVVAPEYKGRPRTLLPVSVNPESSHNLEIMTLNAAKGDFLIKPPDWSINLMVPVKHTSAMVVPSSGPVKLYFRTPEDLKNYQTRTLSLPGINSGMTAEKWISMQPPDLLRENITYTLVYSGTAYARGKPIGWTFEASSLDFLKTLVKRLDAEQTAEVLNRLQLNLAGAESRGHALNQVIKELGIQ